MRTFRLVPVSLVRIPFVSQVKTKNMAENSSMADGFPTLQALTLQAKNPGNAQPAGVSEKRDS